MKQTHKSKNGCTVTLLQSKIPTCLFPNGGDQKSFVQKRENCSEVITRERNTFLVAGKPGNQLLLARHSLLIGVLYFVKYRLLQTRKKSEIRNIGMFFVYFQFTSALKRVRLAGLIGKIHSFLFLIFFSLRILRAKKFKSW